MRMTSIILLVSIFCNTQLLANNYQITSINNQTEGIENLLELKLSNFDDVNDAYQIQEINIIKIKLKQIRKINAQNQIDSYNLLKKRIMQKSITFNERGGCDEGYVDDCSGDGDCCLESWIGDGFGDCEDQTWGCDMTCYDNDGGDCAPSVDPFCGDGVCNGDETEDSCLDDCSEPEPGDCETGEVIDCSGDGDCCPESWIGDGFLDCEDQPYDCDLTCYDNDGGDCDPSSDPFCGDGVCNGDETEDSCLDDCSEPDPCGNPDWVGDGWCDGSNNNEGCGYDSGDCCESTCVDAIYSCDTYGGCNGECLDPNGSNDNCSEPPEPDECGDGLVDDCSGDGDCCLESWIGDGFEDCEDQQWGCDMTCYDNDGGDCDPSSDPFCGDGVCNGDETEDSCLDDCSEPEPGECGDGFVDDCSDTDCCPEDWIGDDFADCEDQQYGCDLSCYDNDGGDCDASVDPFCGDGDCNGDETDLSCAEDCAESEYFSAFIMIGESSGSPGEEVEVPIFYESTIPIGGIQFIITDSPDLVTANNLSTMNDDCFEASYNDVNGGLIGVLFSLEGCNLDASDELSQLASITYELSADADWGSQIELSIDDIIISDGVGNPILFTSQGSILDVSLLGDVSSDGEINVIDVVSIISFILLLNEPTDYQSWAADVNEDYQINVLDVVILVDIILE